MRAHMTPLALRLPRRVDVGRPLERVMPRDPGCCPGNDVRAMPLSVIAA
jgi:hypothetical protein